MPFDLVGARKAGFSDEEILSELSDYHSFDLEGARAAGFSDEKILSTLVERDAKPQPQEAVPNEVAPDITVKPEDPQQPEAAPALRPQDDKRYQDEYLAKAKRIAEGTPDEGMRLYAGAAGAGVSSAASGISGAAEFLGETIGSDSLADWGKEAHDYWAEDAKLLRPKTKKGTWDRVAADTVESVTRSLTAMAAGNTTAALTIMGADVMGSEFHKMRKEGYGYMASAAASLGYGAAEVAGEALPVGHLLNNRVTKSAVTDLARGAKNYLYDILSFEAKEVVGELGTETLQATIDKLTYEDGMTWKDLSDRLVHTAVTSVIAAPVQHSAVRGTQRILSAVRDHNAKKMDAGGDTNASKGEADKTTDVGDKGTIDAQPTGDQTQTTEVKAASQEEIDLRRQYDKGELTDAEFEAAKADLAVKEGTSAEWDMTPEKLADTIKESPEKAVEAIDTATEQGVPTEAIEDVYGKAEAQVALEARHGLATTEGLQEVRGAVDRAAASTIQRTTDTTPLHSSSEVTTGSITDALTNDTGTVGDTGWGTVDVIKDELESIKPGIGGESQQQHEAKTREMSDNVETAALKAKLRVKRDVSDGKLTEDAGRAKLDSIEQTQREADALIADASTQQLAEDTGTKPQTVAQKAYARGKQLGARLRLKAEEKAALALRNLNNKRFREMVTVRSRFQKTINRLEARVKKGKDLEATKRLMKKVLRSTPAAKRDHAFRAKFEARISNMRDLKNVRKILIAIGEGSMKSEQTRIIGNIKKISKNILNLDIEAQMKLGTILGSFNLNGKIPSADVEIGRRAFMEYSRNPEEAVGYLSKREINKLNKFMDMEKTDIESLPVKDLLQLEEEVQAINLAAHQRRKQRREEAKQAEDRVVKGLSGLKNLSSRKGIAGLLQRVKSGFDLKRLATPLVAEVLDHYRSHGGFHDIIMKPINAALDKHRQQSYSRSLELKDRFEKLLDRKHAATSKRTRRPGGGMFSPERMRAIDIFLHKTQAGGVEALERSGVSREEIDAAEPKGRWERELVDIIRDTYAREYAGLNDAHNLLRGKPLGHIENYTHWVSDREDAPTVEEGLFGSKTIEQEVTGKGSFPHAPRRISAVKTRLGNGKLIIGDPLGKLGKYIDDAAYYSNVQPTLDPLLNGTNRPEFKKSVGDLTASFVRGHLDMIARRGGHADLKHTTASKIAKYFISNVGASTLQINPSPTIKQLLGIISALPYAGRRMLSPQVMRDAFSIEEHEWLDISPDVYDRALGDITVKDMDSQIAMKDSYSPLMKAAVRYHNKLTDFRDRIGFWSIMKADAIVARTAWLASYKKALIESGGTFSIKDVRAGRLDPAAKRYADKTVAITQSSAHWKDTPKMLMGPNRVGARALFQFGSTVLTISSQMTHGTKKALVGDEDPTKAMAIAMASLSVGAADLVITNMLASLIGDPYAEERMKRQKPSDYAAAALTANMPVYEKITSLVNFMSSQSKRTGSPTFDTVRGLLSNVGADRKTWSAQHRADLKAFYYGTAVLGLPLSVVKKIHQRYGLPSSSFMPDSMKDLLGPLSSPNRVRLERDMLETAAEDAFESLGLSNEEGSPTEIMEDVIKNSAGGAGAVLEGAAELFAPSEAGAAVPTGREKTMHFEGSRPRVYLDSKGMPTIGVGQTLTKAGFEASVKAISKAIKDTRTEREFLNNVKKEYGIASENVDRALRYALREGIAQAKKDQIHGNSEESKAPWVIPDAAITSAFNISYANHEKQASSAFNDVVSTMTAKPDNNVKTTKFEDLPLAAKEVITDMTYNMGPGKLKVFDFIKLIAEGRYMDAAYRMGTTRWYRDVRGGNHDSAMASDGRAPYNMKRIAKLDKNYNPRDMELIFEAAEEFRSKGIEGGGVSEDNANDYRERAWQYKHKDIRLRLEEFAKS